MGSHAKASVQNAVGEIAATNPPEIAAPPSTEPLQRITILDPRAPRSTTTPEQERLVPSAVGTSTSARPSAEEAAIPGQQETLTRIIPSSEPTLVSGQSGSYQTYFPSQGNGTPGLEGITRLSTEVTLMRPLAEAPLSSTEYHNTPGQEHSIDLPLETPPLESSAESQIQASTPEDVPAGRASSTGTVPPIISHAEPETRAAAQKNGMPDLESFYEKYKTMVQPARLDEFRSTLGRKRHPRAYMYEDKDCTNGGRPWFFSPLSAKGLRQKERCTLLVEDVDIEWISVLDAEFGLDPQFIVRYVGYSHFLDPSFPPFGHASCRNDAGMAGNWYINRGTTYGKFSRRWHDPSRTARRGVPKSFDRAEAIDEIRPWWGEACRQERFPDSEQFFVRSKIACYCLSDDLRKLRL
jgi:hypothetical protein